MISLEEVPTELSRASLWGLELAQLGEKLQVPQLPAASRLHFTSNGCPEEGVLLGGEGQEKL